MRFRKLVVLMLVGIMLLSFSGINTYAAEEAPVTKEIADADINADTITDTTVTTQEVVSNETSVENEKENIKGVEEVKEIEEVKEVEEKEIEEKEIEEKEVKKVTKKKVAKYTKAELRLLSALIYCESNGESYKGKLAVGIVVMNRKRSSIFPDTVKGVIYQRYQFGPASNGSLAKALSEYDNGKFTSAMEKDCIKAAKEALNGTKTITINDTKKDFGKYLYFSGGLRGYTYRLGNHKFK